MLMANTKKKPKQQFESGNSCNELTTDEWRVESRWRREEWCSWKKSWKSTPPFRAEENPWKTGESPHRPTAKHQTIDAIDSAHVSSCFPRFSRVLRASSVLLVFFFFFATTKATTIFFQVFSNKVETWNKDKTFQCFDESANMIERQQKSSSFIGYYFVAVLWFV